MAHNPFDTSPRQLVTRRERDDAVRESQARGARIKELEGERDSYNGALRDAYAARDQAVAAHLEALRERREADNALNDAQQQLGRAKRAQHLLASTLRTLGIDPVKVQSGEEQPRSAAEVSEAGYQDSAESVDDEDPEGEQPVPEPTFPESDAARLQVLNLPPYDSDAFGLVLSNVGPATPEEMKATTEQFAQFARECGARSGVAFSEPVVVD